MKAELPALTGLRGIAAAWVLGLHVEHLSHSTGAKLLGAAGYLGVDIFFVLSGFVLAHNYAHLVDAEPLGRWYGRFIWKRLARIYPAHLAAVCLFAIYVALLVQWGIGYNRILTGGNLLRTLTLTHAWAFPIPKHWLPVSWSISAEFAAYLVFPVIAAAALRVRSAWVAIAGLVALFVPLWSIQDANFSGTMAYGLVRILIEFPAGVLLYRLWQLRGFERGAYFDRAGWLVIAILIFAANAIDMYFGEGYSLAFMPIIACRVVYCVAACSASLDRFLSSQPMQVAGRLSYSFYLVHGLWLGVASALLKKYGMTDSAVAPAAIALAILAAVGCSGLFYRFIEEPARRLMLRRPGERAPSYAGLPEFAATVPATAPPNSSGDRSPS